ncbi:hypothetical protein D3C78_1716820 [compost metagenome]
MEKSLGTHTDGAVDRMAKCAPGLLDNFTKTTFYGISFTAQNSIDDVIVYCPTENIIKLKGRDQVLFKPSAQGMTQFDNSVIR